MNMSSKLCICGRSSKYPLCDNGHQDEDWSCVIEETTALHGFASSVRYQNIVQKLAAHYKGDILKLGNLKPQVDTLIIIIDGTDLEQPLAIYEQANYRQAIVICFGVGGQFIQPVFPQANIYHFEEGEVFHAFNHVKSILIQKPTPFKMASKSQLPSIFLSHAVLDEELLMPAIEYLNQYYKTDIFTCADSIRSGSRWQKEIIRALNTQDIFVILLSEAYNRSLFCAFEVGCAYALEKNMVAISLDGSMPPAFIQHLQVTDLPRIQKRMPWLDIKDILVDELLRVLVE